MIDRIFALKRLAPVSLAAALLFAAADSSATPPDGRWYGKPDPSGRGCGEPLETDLVATLTNNQMTFRYGDEANDPRDFTINFQGHRAPEDWFAWNVWNKYGSKWDLHTANISAEHNGRGIRIRFYSPFMGDRLGCNYFIYFLPYSQTERMSLDEVVAVYKGDRIINPETIDEQPRLTVEPQSAPPKNTQQQPTQKSASIEDRLRTISLLLEKGLLTEDEAISLRQKVLEDL